MDEPKDILTAEENNTTTFDDLNSSVHYDSKEMSPVKFCDHESGSNINDSNDEDQAPMKRIKKKFQHFSDSDIDSDNEKGSTNSVSDDTKNHDVNIMVSELEVDTNNIKSKSIKPRIQLDYSDSDTLEESRINKNEEQQIRMKNKRTKLKKKFRHLLNSRHKQCGIENICDKSIRTAQDSESSDSEISSIKTIKQKIRDSMSIVSSLCEPDTSDEEEDRMKKPENKSKPKERKAKLTSPKPIRMSAKEAMENMQKIRSESNRMLREKEVYLPYHRPKALSLKDIMNRRKPAVTTDGKALPIKMNVEQLQQYAQLLDERQKEMIKLCKSDTDEEETNELKMKSEDFHCESNKMPINSPEINADISDVHKKLETDGVGCKNVQSGNIDKEIVQKDSTDTHENTSIVSEIIQEKNNDCINVANKSEQQNSFDTDIKLVYNDSTDERNIVTENIILSEQQLKHSGIGTEPDSQVINLHFDSEKSDHCSEEVTIIQELNTFSHSKNLENMATSDDKQDFLSDDDVNMDDIDKIIEDAELLDNEDVDSSININKALASKLKPTLSGAPGMVIDLDNSNPIAANKLSGVEFLKEKFTYFSKLKTPEELEREKEKILKPGTQHLKLKQELEKQIAEQRSLEWAKRLEEEKQQHAEMNAIQGDYSDAEDDIDNIESKLEESNEKAITSESEEELIEDDVEIKDKPRNRNPMFDDEAQESDCDENDAIGGNMNKVHSDIDEEDDGVQADDDENDDEESSDESSESEEEETSKPKRGRILKAFEDSDDEQITNLKENNTCVVISSPAMSQDDEIQLAQTIKSASDDIFSSQSVPSISKENENIEETANGLTQPSTQTFSILDVKPSNTEIKSPERVAVLYSSQPYHDPNLDALASGLSQNLLNSQVSTHVSQSQTIGEDILALCTGKFYDNAFISQTDDNQHIDTDSQQTCTDDFYDYNLNCDTKNKVMVNKVDEGKLDEVKLDEDKVDDDKVDKGIVDEDIVDEAIVDENKIDEGSKIIKDNLNQGGYSNDNDVETNLQIILNKTAAKNVQLADDGMLKSILDELDNPVVDEPKPNKFFTGATQKRDTTIERNQLQKKFTIDSDDESNGNNAEAKRKKTKKKKLEKRVLHISDDEEEEQYEQDEEEYVSDIDEDPEKVVEYDSEENEIEVMPLEIKKKRKATDFFEQEAELTSEDEWVGSGDEDEAGLDRMEREEGDDEVFHQGQLRRELGQIHMRDVLDQDKREVRLLQELLFEDGDLGGGHRQRKFRWRNADGSEETGAGVDEFGDTQEEEFDSEEQWRKQRHERELFLRQMQNKEEDLSVSVNRTTIIKANLSSKTMSSLLLEVNQSKIEKTEVPVVVEKKSAKDVPSPKKSFAIFQQNYHGSLLTRGRGALARLAALATPLAVDEDTPKIGSLAPSSKRNFVFAALTPNEKRKNLLRFPRPLPSVEIMANPYFGGGGRRSIANAGLPWTDDVTKKRTADTNLGTPILIKKMKTEDKKTNSKSSLLDHFIGL